MRVGWIEEDRLFLTARLFLLAQSGVGPTQQVRTELDNVPKKVQGMSSAGSPRLEVRFYPTVGGREPVRDWLSGLDRTTLQAVSEDLRTLQFGWPLGMPLVRKLEPGLWEVRSHAVVGVVRVLFTLADAEIVLLHAFVKKSQALPKEAVALARRRMREVQRG